MPWCEIRFPPAPSPVPAGKIHHRGHREHRGEHDFSEPAPSPARMHEALPRNPGSVASLDLQPIATPSRSCSPQNYSLESRRLNAIGRGHADRLKCRIFRRDPIATSREKPIRRNVCTNPNGIQAIAQGRRAREATLGQAPEGDFNRNAVVAIGGGSPMLPGAAMWMALPATTALRLDFVGMVFPGQVLVPRPSPGLIAETPLAFVADTGVEDGNNGATGPTSPTHPHPGAMPANACCDPPSVLSVSSVVTFPPASTGYKPNLPIRFICRTENVFV
jgi:hypothetical protein